MSAANTWLTPRNVRYYYPDQPRQAPSSTTESSPISPQQFVDWLGSSPIEPAYAPRPYLEPMGVTNYAEESEEVEFDAEEEPEAEHDQETEPREKRERENSEAESEPSPSKKRRRRTGEDGAVKIRSSRACTVCRGFKAKCMPGPSLREPDEDSPCMRCSMHGYECVFTKSLRGKYPTKKFARLQKQLEHMERTVQLLDEALQAQSRSRRYSLF
ncbi:hypothetical protein FRC07_014907 [Ceratobasidium sp. 392]|nr:hypothetical protein FRC07_014907 [Ceratobasidium sp. 392]